MRHQQILPFHFEVFLSGRGLPQIILMVLELLSLKIRLADYLLIISQLLNHRLQNWCAHNGDLKDFLPEPSGRFTPVGNTDSERAFCYLLDQLVKRFGYDEPKLDQVFDLLTDISPSIAEHGTFNFCLSNGQALFTYATTKLHWLVREYPFKPAQLIDIEVEVDFSQVTTPEDRVAVITTEPLTQNEEWTAFQEGEMILFRDGAKYRSQLTHVARLERERLDPSLKRVTKADLY